MCTTCGCPDANSVKITPVGGNNQMVLNTSLPKWYVHLFGKLLGYKEVLPIKQEDITAKKIVHVEQDVLGKNNLLAAQLRGFFEAKQTLVFNLVSSPGSGKTSLLERTLISLPKNTQAYVIEGDQQTSNDAERIAKTGTKVVQVNTGQGCHLDADMIQKGVKELQIAEQSILFIENVGNLVCPAMFDLGEDLRVVVISTTEGDDKPIKYPDMFHSAQICIINKIDLLPYVNFDIERCKKYALQVNKQLMFIELSATSGEGMEQWIKWINSQLLAKTNLQ